MTRTTCRGLLLAAVLLVGVSTRAGAGVVIHIDQVGADVVAAGAGTIDLSDLSRVGGGLLLPLMTPNFGLIGEGPPAGGPVDPYAGISVPPPFGTGGTAIPTSAAPGSDCSV